MARMSSRQRRDEENQRRWKAVNIDFNPADAQSLVLGYKKKAERRMKVFYEESKRIEKKFPEMMQKVTALGYNIGKLTINEVDKENLFNYRKKTKALSFDVEATRDTYKLTGKLLITPASMRLELTCPTLKRVTTKSGYGLPTFRCSYYRTLNIRDNYLISLVGGGTHARVEEDETTEVPF